MKIAISVGHTIYGAGTGAVGRLTESVENRNVSNKVVEFLRQQGHTVDLIRLDKREVINGKEEKDYVTRTRIANTQIYDLFAEIHFNDAEPTGHGTEVYYTSTKGKTYAQNIVNSIAELGYRNRGAKYTDDLYVVMNTKAVAVLIECCFVNSTEDYNRYNAVDMARAIVKGITGQAVVVNSIPADFDALRYLMLNEDALKIALGSNLEYAYEHYLKYGIKEGRRYK